MICKKKQHVGRVVKMHLAFGRINTQTQEGFLVAVEQGWRTYGTRAISGTRADFCWHGTFMISLSETSYRALVQSSFSRVTNSS